ncbi:MAG TPA: hypothetical protein VFR47_17170 [Anaerolineales bacterium]|nr:hypothetical protein [Anaerolineales bacterium]
MSYSIALMADHQGNIMKTEEQEKAIISAESAVKNNPSDFETKSPTDG